MVAGHLHAINRVQVRGYDAQNEEQVRKTIDVWYDDGSTVKEICQHCCDEL